MVHSHLIARCVLTLVSYTSLMSGANICVRNMCSYMIKDFGPQMTGDKIWLHLFFFSWLSKQFLSAFPTDITQKHVWYSVAHCDTGRAFTCCAVGPKFNSQQGQGILQGLFCSVLRWHTTPVVKRVGLVLVHFPFTNAASQWLYVNLVCRFHTPFGRFSLGTLVSFHISGS